MKLLIRIIKFGVLFAAILALIGIALSLLYGEKIEQYILKNIRQKSLTEIAVKDVNFSVFENFPYASIKLTDVLILATEANQNDTLLHVNQGYLQFNIFNLISKKRKLSKIVLIDSELNIKYDKEGNPNFKIFKQSDQQDEKIQFHQIYFSNCFISYLHQQNKIDIKGKTDKVLLQFNENQKTNFLVEGNLFIQNLCVGKTDYIHKKQSKVDAEFVINDSAFYIKNSNISIEDVNFNLDGNIQNRESELNIKVKNQQLKSVMLHTPEKFKSIYKAFTLDGILNCHGTIKGVISKTSNPHFNMDFDFSNANFNLKENHFHLSDLQLNGNINNGRANNFEQTLIKVQNCSAKTRKGALSGSFQLKNLNHYYLTTDINSTLDLAEVNHLFKRTPFLNMKGKLIANTKYSGNFAFSSKMKNYFLLGNHLSEVQLKDVEFLYKKFPLLFSLPNLKGQIINDTLKLENSLFTIADSDFKFNGRISKFISYLLQESPKISIEGEMESIYVKFDELMSIKNMNAEQKKSISTLPNWLEIDVQTTIDQLSYQYFIAEQIQAGIEYSNFTLKAKKVKMNTLNGQITGEAKFYERPYNYLKLVTAAHLEKINIRNLFTGFQNFGQEFIQAKHLKGEGTADIQLKSSWTPGLKFDRDKLQLNSHLIIEKGELISFAPLLSLSSYVSVDELKDVKFSTLENTIKIGNNNINIPAMEIKSSALSLFISGTHSFNNEIDYQIKLLLSELISKRARKRNTNLDKQLFVEDDGLGKTTLYLKMDGTVDDPNIYFDKISIKEKIKTEIKKEKEEIKKIVKEDLFNQKTDSTKKQETTEVILEWDDE
tara:strand:- start:17793 stop:20276 length:2484 start_codon:yes stop_codon:yes gene_type:complete